MFKYYALFMCLVRYTQNKHKKRKRLSKKSKQ